MKRIWSDLSCRWKITIPILVLGVVLTVTIYRLKTRHATNEVIESAVAQARIISMQIRELRGYYTNNVISVAENNGLAITHDYAGKKEAIPLPATMVHELNSVFTKKADYEIRLYSNLPFPFRTDGGVRDDFGKQAIHYLTKNPEEQFWEVEEYNGKSTLRYTTPDRMVSQTCVECHNSHPQSPKTDWKLGDVRGVLEVNIPLNKGLESYHGEAAKSTILIGSFMLVIVVTVSFLLHHFVIRRLNEAAVAGGKIADGDLTARVHSVSNDESGRILSTIGNMTEKLNELIGRVQRSSTNVNNSTAQLSAEAKQLESVVAEQAASANEIAATTTEISKTSDNLVKTMEEVSSMSSETAESAVSGEDYLHELEVTLNKMGSAAATISSKLSVISERTSKITAVMKTMTTVAEQTNLISFNAGIESAKSGEHGRRFSIIAKEIRQLADQSAKASQDIRQIIAEMQGAVSEGVASIDDFVNEVQKGIGDASNIRDRLEEIIEKVQTVAPQFETVSNGMETQSQGARLIQESVADLSKGAQQIAKSLHETNRSIEELTQVSSRLQTDISHFKL